MNFFFDEHNNWFNCIPANTHASIPSRNNFIIMSNYSNWKTGFMLKFIKLLVANF